jgi:prepilin-type N-terminal cleavage/methylation domain-containing protein
MDLEHRQALLGRTSRPEARGSVAARARGEKGFSLIEVLIAAGIFLVVALGIVPFFTQAIVNNRAGADYTQSTNYAKSELERLFSLPMSSPDLQVTTGTSAVTVAFYSKATQTWVNPLTGTDVALWTRTVTIRQYSLSGMLNGGALADALDASTPAAFVHAKQIQVNVVSGRPTGVLSGPLGGGKQATLSVFKTF